MTEILKDKIIVTTHSKYLKDELNTSLSNAGAIVLYLPMIEVVPVGPTDRFKKIFTNITDFQVIVFTSKNGVNFFFSLFKEAVGSVQQLKNIKFACIGRKTANALLDHGFAAFLVGEGNNSEELSEDLMKLKDWDTYRYLLPLGNLAPQTMLNWFGLHGIDALRINVYETKMPEQIDHHIIDQVIQDKYDLITFKSPSAFTNFYNLISKKTLSSTLRIGSIGSTTSMVIQEKDIQALFTSSVSNDSGLYNEIVRHFTTEKNK